MAYQIVSKHFGYRLGWLGRCQKRYYVKIVDGQIELTPDVSESGLFSQAEIVDLFVRLMGKAKHQYFIFEDEIDVYSVV